MNVGGQMEYQNVYKDDTAEIKTKKINDNFFKVIAEQLVKAIKYRTQVQEELSI